jgi:hypothetical protein
MNCSQACGSVQADGQFDRLITFCENRRMRSDTHGKMNSPTLMRYVSAALLVYGLFGVAIQARLLPLMAEGLLSWVRPPDGLPSWPLLGPLQAHYDAFPWLPWAAWLAGLGLLAYRRTVPHDDAVGSAEGRALPRWIAPAALLILLLIAGYIRMSLLWPQSAGISQLPYDDEGVYAGTSQLFLQGILPYRDYFFAHPPIAAISYAPAMAYHFNEWGSPTSFMMGRYLSVAYSLVTLMLLFFIGNRLAGLWGGVLAGSLWALDGRVVEINRKIMLDGPMVLFSCAALLLYLLARPALAADDEQHPPKRPWLLLALAGACGAASALTKIAGVACLIAILVDMVWLYLDSRRHQTTLRLSRQLLSLMGGVLATMLLVVGPFALLAPSQLVRYVFFFQLLRPGDGLIDVPSRVADLSSTLGNALTLLFMAVGLVAMSLWVWRNKSLGVARVAVLWMLFSMLLFTYSRSFYGHYYIQLAAPLCLLGAGVSFLPHALGMKWPASGVRFIASLPLALLALVAVPFTAIQWSVSTTRQENRLFEIVARYTNNAVPPGTAVLTTDEQFNFLAARPPSRNATGYLIDSYGHMISLGLDLPTRSWGDLWSAAMWGQHSNDVYAVMQLPAPQQDILDRAAQVPLVVIHDKGFARLTPATIAAIETNRAAVERTTLYTIYRADRR